MNIPKRVLHVVSSMNRGGAETMIMNLYRNIDKNKLQFDFVCHIKEKCDFEQEIYSLGGRIIRISSLGQIGLNEYINNLRKVISRYGPYQAVHAHTDIQAGIVMLAAKLEGIPIRVCHSHNTKWKENPRIKDNLQSYILRYIGRKTATNLCACGKDAAIFFFGKRAYEKNQVTILNNGIDIESFNNINNVDIVKLKRQIGIKDDSFIIGHIGRFYEQKNHMFIVELAKELQEKNVKFNILLVGDGPLKEAVKQRVYDNNLDKNIKFLGVRDDVPMLLNIFDIFIFPSFYEGLPVTLIEAQASGVKCIISDTITEEVDLGLGLIERVSLSNKDKWISYLLNKKSKCDISIINKKVSEAGYNARNNVRYLNKLYDIT
ncbi:MAG: glycosyltransferase family 1 protein [Clostridium saudiense]|uniref:glycosyltransferase family 1 protein n=1 Tax=Clostridium saudiense TaxID=1414720 RepID=UPI0018ABFFC5|nr:glycosyltransferase family 1 protein [Clostridium saudiense]